ncbi:hypothetical protein AMTR_s00453p00010790 [Amborella trichopoda]|uniref:Xyloglucan endotransglucosylase/hydrolase n=2 Tax=Amborella trichopoda TaxID=13333 RepID=U5D867_AMBTC|nr:hypothetical protein AMTR_s00453p00010790 [Amborella trichopoda]
MTRRMKCCLPRKFAATAIKRGLPTLEHNNSPEAPRPVSLMALSMSFSFYGWVVYAFAIATTVVYCATFDELFEPSWAQDHFMYEGETLKLKLDNSSGAGFGSKSKYLFGKTSVEIKLVEGDSAGTVTAFYMSSDGPNHNEFDFEFLGNTTGEPYLVQTNIYVNGVGNREMRHSFWFDPTKDFHSYSLFWNQNQVMFLVDETPLRVFRNKEKEGIPFPKDQSMGVYSSIWNADDWATQGGRVKTDWSHAPFVSTYRGFNIDACECPTSEHVRICSTASVGDGKRYWWASDWLAGPNVHQAHQMAWVRAHHLVYDYCEDSARFPAKPPEC